MLLNEMEIFYYVVELKSFSRAATRLGVSKSFISKKITKLEHELKVNLIARSTRKLMITEAGDNFYRYCTKVVEEGHEAYSLMSELQGKPSGTLKISMPPAIGLNLIAPMLAEYLKTCSEVTLNVELENRLVDVYKEGHDLVLRSAKLETSNLVAQKIYSIKNVLCASESYLKTHAEPKNIFDLEKYNIATYNSAKTAAKMSFLKNHHQEYIHIKGNFLCNQMDLIKKMVLDHVCMAILPEFMVTNEIKNNLIKICLPEYQLTENPLFAIYPERKFMLPKLRIFIGMLKTYLLSC
jgi:DNA-binding transcriptional LysR family regulator